MQQKLKDHKDITDFDFYICACRTSGKTLSFVNNYFKNYERIFHNSWCMRRGDGKGIDKELLDIANVAQAHGIVKILDEAF